MIDGAEIRCVEKIHGHLRTPVNSRVGGTLPAHSTALGRVLLAYAPPATRRRVLDAALAACPVAAGQPSQLAAELRSTPAGESPTTGRRPIRASGASPLPC